MSDNSSTLRGWLRAEVTTSPRHAALQRFYFGWLRLKGNPLALFGLSVLLFLIAAAAGA